MPFENNVNLTGADMSRFLLISKKIAHAFILFHLCLIGLGVLLIIGAIKIVDTLWHLLMPSVSKRHQAASVHQPEDGFDALLSADASVQGVVLTLPSSAQEEPSDSIEHAAAIARYQSMPPRYDDFDERYEEDEFLAEPEVDQPLIRIEILRRDEASEPNMPSSFFPGCGSDGASFQVVGDDKPAYDDLCTALYSWADDACLIDYDHKTGVGYFRIVDGEAPEKGSVIDLE
jgi:hypothetical protein